METCNLRHMWIIDENMKIKMVSKLKKYKSKKIELIKMIQNMNDQEAEN